MSGLYHIQLRKRIFEHLEPFPARTEWKRLLDKLVVAVGIAGPLTAMPQILRIFLLHNALSVSTLSWGLAGLLDIPWIVYGIAHRERAIAITFTLWLIMNAIVFFGAIAYGSGPY